MVLPRSQVTNLVSPYENPPQTSRLTVKGTFSPNRLGSNVNPYLENPVLAQVNSILKRFGYGVVKLSYYAPHWDMNSESDSESTLR